MTKKTFDAVKLMRELRDRLSREIEKMTPEERMRHIRDRAASTGFQLSVSKGGPTLKKPAADGAPRRR